MHGSKTEIVMSTCNSTWEFITLTRWPEIIWWCINFIVIITEFVVCVHKALLERRWDRVWKITNDFTKLILEATKHGMCCWKRWCSGCGHLSCCSLERLQPSSNKFDGLPLFCWQRERPEVSVNMWEGVNSCTIVKCMTWLWIRTWKSYMWVSRLMKHLMSWWPAGLNIENKYKIGLQSAILRICGLNLSGPTLSMLRSRLNWANDSSKLK